MSHIIGKFIQFNTKQMSNTTRKLILFDIDGTILLFKQNLAKKLFTEFLTELFEFEVSEHVIPSFAGMTDLQILRIVSENLNIPYQDITDKLPHIWSRMKSKFEDHSTAENIKLMPGIVELLNLFAENEDNFLGLITGNYIENAYLKLDSYKLRHFFHIGAFGDDDENRNHLPPIAINRANLYLKSDLFNNKNTVIIGDTDRDVECAKVHNIKSVAVATGGCNAQFLNEQHPDLLFNDFSDYKNSYEMIMNLFE